MRGGKLLFYPLSKFHEGSSLSLKDSLGVITEVVGFQLGKPRFLPGAREVVGGGSSRSSCIIYLLLETLYTVKR